VFFCLFVIVAVGLYWDIYVKLGSFESNKESDCQLVLGLQALNVRHATCRKYLKDCSSSFMTTLILAILRVFLHFIHC